jgi:hypothetical protein
VTSLAAQYNIPACYEWRDPVVVGGLMSYNTDRDESARHIENYTAQIQRVSNLICPSCNYQPWHRKGARPDDTARAARTGRRIDRIGLAMSAFGT